MPNRTAPLLFANQPRLSDAFMALALPNVIGSLERASSRFGMHHVFSGRPDRDALYTRYKNQAVFNQNGAVLPDVFDPIHSSRRKLPLNAVLQQLTKAYDHLSLDPKNVLITALADRLFLQKGIYVPPDLDPLALLQGRDLVDISPDLLISAQTLHDWLHYGIDHRTRTAGLLQTMAQVTGAFHVQETHGKYCSSGYLWLHFPQGLPVVAIPHPFLDKTWTIQRHHTLLLHNSPLKLQTLAATQVLDVKTRLSQAGYSIVD